MEEIIGCSVVLYVHTNKQTVKEEFRTDEPSELGNEVGLRVAEIVAIIRGGNNGNRES